MAEQAARAAGFAAEALDFAPDLLAIQERPPARMPRAAAGSVVALLVLLLAWAVFFELDIVATAPGRLVPVSYTKVVQPADAGVVREILVEDGDAVQAGQLLLRLDPRLAQADTEALDTEVALLQGTLSLTDAELDERPATLARGERMDVRARVESRFRARRLALADASAQETEALNKALADLEAARQVLSKLVATLPSYRQSADAFRQLQQQGFVGEVAAAEKAREAVEREQDLKAQQANVTALQAGVEHARKRLAALRSDYRSQLERERVETLAALARSSKELAKSTVRAEMLEIRAPNAGVVKDLAVTTQGAVVSAGTVLMNIVPVDEPLQAEVLLGNEDSGFVAPGQAVKLKVAAYPFQKYGMLDGHVALVSADSADPRQTPAGQPPALTYRALIKLDALRSMGVAGVDLQLNPGMLVTAEIHQGKRNVLEYLLSPVRKIAQEAARER